MEKNYKKGFILKSSVSCIVLIGMAFLFNLYFEISHAAYFFAVPIFALIINILGYISSTSKSSKRNISTSISSLFGIKFFSYLLMSLIFFLIEKDTPVRLIFVSFIFIVYLVNSIILVSSVLKHSRNTNHS